MSQKKCRKNFQAIKRKIKKKFITFFHILGYVWFVESSKENTRKIK